MSLWKNKKSGRILPALFMCGGIEGGAQCFECLFFDSADVGTGDAELCRDFALGLWRESAQTVAQDNNTPFAIGENGVDIGIEFFHFELESHVVNEGVIAAEHIEQREGVAVLVAVDLLIERDIGGSFFLCAKVHQNFIFNAAGGRQKN